MEGRGAWGFCCAEEGWSCDSCDWRRRIEEGSMGQKADGGAGYERPGFAPGWCWGRG